jgi:MFS family permease
VTVAWQIYQETRDPFAMGLMGLFEVTGVLCGSFFSGRYVDSHDRRRVYLQTLLCFGLVALAFAAITQFVTSSEFRVIALYAGSVVVGLLRSLQSPAQFGLLSELLEKSKIARGSAANSTAWQFAAALGPAVGGWLLATTSLTHSYIVVAFIILASCAVVKLMKHRSLDIDLSKTHSKEPFYQSLALGMRFVWNRPPLFWSMALDLFAVLFGGLVVLLPLFADQVLKAGPEGLGILRTCTSVGATAMALFLSWRPLRMKAGSRFLWSVAGFGLAMIAFALSESFLLSCALLIVGGALDSVSVVVRGTILQIHTPDQMRGRVAAVKTIFISSSNELGAFESGAAAKLFGLVPSVVLGGFITCLSTLWVAWKCPELRKLEFGDQK